MDIYGSGHERIKAPKKGGLKLYKKWLNFGLTTLFFVSLIGLTAFVSGLADAEFRANDTSRLASDNKQSSTEKPTQTNLSEAPKSSKQATNNSTPGTNPDSAADSSSSSQTSDKSTANPKPLCNKNFAKTANRLYEFGVKHENERHKNKVSDLLAKLNLKRYLNPDWYQMLLDEENNKHESKLGSLLETYTSSLNTAHCSKNIFIQP